jgi:Ca2+-binding EF-hand superfamily protein
MNRKVSKLGRVAWLTTILMLASAASAMAQGRGGFGGGIPSAEESFRRLDLDQNGQIDPSEFQQVDGTRRGFLTQMGFDGSRPISLREYTEKRDQFFQSNNFSQFRRPDGGGGGGPPSFGGGGPPSFGGGGPPSFGGGGPPSFGGIPGGGRPGEPERREESRSEDRDRRDRERDRDRDRDGSSSSKSSKKKDSKPKPRVTQSLPDEYRSKDKNGDGQIGLYEWDRKAFAQFFALDRNGDGFLTPDELIAATKKSGSSSSSKTSAGIAPTAPTETKAAPTSETTKASDSATASKPAEVAASSESSAAIKSFNSLDRNNDGKLSEEEWQRSRTAREKFKKAGIEVTLPIEQAQFVEWYNQADAQ